jgi:hypothetical protein
MRGLRSETGVIEGRLYVMKSVNQVLNREIFETVSLFDCL